MTASLIQSALSAGEIAPELYGEVSLAKYNSAVTTGRNAVVNYRGGALSRGGLAFTGRCKQSTSGSGPPRPIPFQFSNNQGYVLEFGDFYMRVVFQGGYVLEDPVTLTGATKANPCQISVTGTPFANGNWVFISGVVGMTQLDGNSYIVAGATGGSFTLKDLNGNAVDSTAFAAYVSGGTARRYYTITTPYLASDLAFLKFSQTADVMSLTCSNPESGNEYAPYDLTRLAADDWTLIQTAFEPVIVPPTTVSAVANAQAPSSGVNATFAYVVTAVDDKGNESIASGVVSCHGADLQVEAGTNTVTWSLVSGARYYNIYRGPTSVDASSTPVPVPAGSIFGFVGSAYGTQFSDTNTTPSLSQTPPTHKDPFAQGQILAVKITDAGSGLFFVSYAITTAGGSGFAGQPALVAGSLGAFQITNPGHGYAPGDSIAFNGAGVASGSVKSGAVNAAASQTITLNGIVWTFVTSTPTGNQVLIGGSLATTLNNLITALNASSDPAMTVASYSIDVTGQNLLVTYKTAGTAGNAYTLAASAWTVSGATLTGGSGTGTGADPTAILEVGPTSGTYPGVNAYFQQRHFFANSLNNPDTLWASKTGLYNNMDVSIPTQATDAITASPWTEQVNGIQWLIPMPGGLIAMTGLRAWQVVGEGSYQLNSQPITPSTTQAQPQAFNGCSSTIPPIVIDYDVLYVQAIGDTTVFDLSWNFWVNIYTGNDLTILSSHLFLTRKIIQWAWARQPYKVLWACCDDGTLISLTYLKEQNVYGWMRHDTQGLIVGVCSITEPPINAVYVVIQRFTAAFSYFSMERMDARVWQSVEDTYAVDAGVSNPMPTFNAAAFASAFVGSVTIATSAPVFDANSVGKVIRMNGGIATVTHYTNSETVTATWSLSPTGSPIGIFAPPNTWTMTAPVAKLNAPHLAGLSPIVGLADGVPISGLIVSPDGTVALPFAASNVKIGLGFTVQIQTPYLNGDSVVQGARKVIPAVTMRLAGSSSFMIGTNQPDGAAQNPPVIAPTWAGLAPANTLMATSGQTPPVTYTSPSGQTVTPLWTGDLRVVGRGAAWNSKGQVAIQQSLPLPLQILAVMPEVLPGDLPDIQVKPQQTPGQPARGPGRWMIGSGG